MRKFFRILCACLLLFSAGVLGLTAWGEKTLPDSVTAVNGRMELGGILFSGGGNAAAEAFNSGSAPCTVDYNVKLLHLFPVKTVRVNVTGRRYVAVGGELVGVKLKTKGLLVVSTEPFENTQGRNVDPAADAGVKKGDILLSVNGAPLTGSGDLTGAIEDSGGREIEITVQRGGDTLTLTVTPQKTAATGLYKGGLWVKDSTVGVGTLTFSDPETGKLAALGHGVYDADTASLLTVSEGEICTATVSTVKKGAPGAPGEITGILGGTKLGSAEKNCDSGVYGELNCIEGEPDVYPVATVSEVHTGPAQVICTVAEGEKQIYDAEIKKLGDPKDEGKNMVIKITDGTLLSQTGGIVQGMSGSPILQDGMLVGAVTHVFVNDPKSGYAIFAETMLAAAEE